MTGFIIGMAVGMLITYIGTMIGEWRASKRFLLQCERERQICAEEKKNHRVRYYVAKDANGTLRLFLDKPTLFRNSTWYATKKGLLIANNDKIAQYGLDIEKFVSLTHNDEPVEVEITLEGE